MNKQKTETIKKCPKCGSENLTMEKMLNGKTTCMNCGYRDIHHEFQKQIERVGVITHEEAKERTLYLHGKYDEAYKTLNDYISQQEEITTLLKRYEKYCFELIDYISKHISQQEKNTELLGLYQKFHELFSLYSEVESYDDSWGMSTECEVISSNNSYTEISIVDEKLIDLFHQIEQLEKELGEMK